MSEYWKRREEILASDAAKYLGGILKLTDYHNIYYLNYLSFQNAVKLFIQERSHNLEYSAENKRKTLDELLNLSRQLHNLLSSNSFRIQATSRIVQELYRDDSFLDTYKEHVANNYDNDPLAQFVKQLRNYALKYDPVYLVVRSTIIPNKDDQGATIEHKIIIASTLFGDWSGWNLVSKRFLQDNKESIEIIQVLSEYNDQVQNTYRWMKGILNERHKGDMDWYNSQINELN